MNRSSGCAVACLTLALSGEALAQPGPSDHLLNVLVRDMRPGHPDFTLVSPDAFVRVADLLAPQTVGRSPTLSGVGREVLTPAADDSGNLIPPRLAVAATAGAGAGLTSIASAEPTVLRDGRGIDAYAVALESVTYEDDGSSTWVYRVEELPGGQHLASWSVDLADEVAVLQGTTQGYQRSGGRISWSVPESFTSGSFTLVLDQWYEAELRPEGALARAGADTASTSTRRTVRKGDLLGYLRGRRWAPEQEPVIQGQAIPPPELDVAKQRRFHRDRGASTLRSDLHVETLRLRGHTLQIEGDVTILVERYFELNRSKIELAPGASLRIYIEGVARIQNHSSLNADAQDASRVQLYKLGRYPLSIRNRTQAYATLVSPDAALVLSNRAEFFGPVAAKRVLTALRSTLHAQGFPSPPGPMLVATSTVAQPAATPTGCLALADSVPSYGLPHDGAITSEAWFQTWFNTVSGQNAASGRILVMRDLGDGSWRFRSADFRPIDGALYGSATPAQRNGSYTVTVDAGFTAIDCGGQFIELAADGDAWLFVDGELAMDLGGLMPGDRQRLELDRLELTPGPHRLLLFFAHRTEEAAAFELRTNMQLNTFSTRSPVSPLED
ncbi:MAG: hypothetical protein ACF8R7_05400 [Phycisphaerales bacterium JB039]